MAINNFIPTIWSETLHQELDKQYVGVANCNRDFEGEIQEKGAVVKICGVGSVAVNEYEKNTDMSMPQSLTDTVAELRINRAKYFNFQIDDVDRAQSSPKLMEAAMKVAAHSLANEADAYIYSLYNQAKSTLTEANTTPENVVERIIEARAKLYEANVSDTSDVVIEVSPAVAALILKAKANLATDNSASLENGCLGSIAGCKVFVSNNIVGDDQVEENKIFYKCFVRTRRAIAFADQLSEIHAYRPEKRFADAVKGLHLYGANVVYDKELIVLDLGVSIA